MPISTESRRTVLAYTTEVGNIVGSLTTKEKHSPKRGESRRRHTVTAL
jgi:hypothetical protein